MADAMQPNMRKSYSRDLFFNVFDDFLADTRLQGSTILDLGPGQCDFLDILRNRNALTAGFDVDKAVCHLGMARGHRMIQGDVRKRWPFPEKSLDGLFCRGSFNAFWFATDLDLFQVRLNEMLASLKSRGWLWFVPWNRPYEKDGTANDAIQKLQAKILDQYDVKRVVPDAQQIMRYGINYEIPKTEIWLKNLKVRADT